MAENVFLFFIGYKMSMSAEYITWQVGPAVAYLIDSFIFIYLSIWLLQIKAHRIFDLNCSMWDLVP